MTKEGAEYPHVVIGSEAEAINNLIQAVLPTHHKGKHVALHVNPDIVFVNEETTADNTSRQIIHTFISAGQCEKYSECGTQFMRLTDGGVIEYT